MQHDVDYSVCANKPSKDQVKCKNEADKKMVKALDAIPWKDRQWGHAIARNTIATKAKIGKAVVIERFNRTLKNRMYKQFTIQGNTQYLEMLPKIVKEYNNTKHSSIKMTPTEASKKKNEGTVYFNLYGDMEPLSAKPKFKPTHSGKAKHKVRIQKKNGRYYFQHPYARLFVAYFVIFCNFLIYAEDPVSHSRANCTIPVVGNDFAFVTYRYPPGGWSVLKVFMWLAAIVVGLLVGKFFFHKLVFNRWMRLHNVQA
ncbi:hypothetical protein ACROYT_G036880 [Oculina patagonica]